MFIFTKVNLSSDLVCQQFIGAFRKQLLKPFGLNQPEAFSLPSPEFKKDHPTRSSVARFSGFFFFSVTGIFFGRTISLFQLFRQHYLFRCRNFHHFLTLWLAGNDFGLIFSLCTPFSLCLHFTFLSLTVAPGAIFKISFFASV